MGGRRSGEIAESDERDAPGLALDCRDRARSGCPKSSYAAPTRPTLDVLDLRDAGCFEWFADEGKNERKMEAARLDYYRFSWSERIARSLAR